MDDIELKRLVWRSRRGLLELDLQLADFVRQIVPQLNATEQEVYRDLLLVSDNDLLDYLNGKVACPDARLSPMIERIRAAKQAA